MNPNFREIPGLREVVTAQKEALESAFFVTAKRIRGFRVMPLTPEHMASLFYIRSPFVSGGDIGTEDVAKLLWILRPGWCPRKKYSYLRQNLFARRVAYCRDISGLAQDLIEYLNASYANQPKMMSESGASKGPKVEAAYLSQITHIVMSAYGMPWQEVIRTPMSVLWQWIRLIQCERMGRDYQEITAADEYVMNHTAQEKKEEEQEGGFYGVR